MAEQINTMAVLEARLLTRTNILVVDDHPEGLLALEAVLCDQNYNLVKAASGPEALQCALYYDFAVILLDVQMPEMDGFETAKLLRENYRSKKTPIIFVTAINKEARHINQGYESGAVDYIFKPLDPFILKSKVDIFVELFNKNLQVKQQAALLRKMELQEKERQMDELRQESLRQYVNLADAIPHSIIKIKPEGKVEYFNQRWSAYTGFESDIDWPQIVHPDDKRRLLRFWLHMRRRNSSPVSQIELRIRSVRDGVYRWHLVRAVVEAKNGETTGWICTCTDIDDIKKAQEATALLSRQLNRSNRELEEFAYVASHDLKEPLHVVSSFAFLLEKRLEPKLEGHEREYFGFIKQGVHQAQALINELLEYSCIGRERPLETVDLEAVLKQVLASLKFTIEEARAVIQYDPLPRVKANSLEMLQLFQNLVANAIKYRKDKPPEIFVSVKAEYDMWVFSVKDNGIGIEAQFKERIFGMFQRLHPKSEYSGTGIGLAVCKKIIENQGGKIWVESQPGRGSTFCFTIKRYA